MISRDNLQDLYPLSPMQEGMLFHALLEPDSGAYVEQIAYELEGELDQTCFQRAWQNLLERHPILRSCFIHDKTQRPMQAVLKQRELPFQFKDLRGQTPAEQQASLAAFHEADRKLGFHLVNDCLLRVAVFQLKDRLHHVLWSFHHIVLDGWSTGIVIAEVGELYAAHLQGRAPQLPARLPYSHYIKWLEAQSPDALQAYWQARLKDYAATSPLTACKNKHSAQNKNSVSNTASNASSIEERILQLPEAATCQLTQAAANLQVTLNTLVQLAWSALLYQYSEQQDIVFGSIVSGRPAELPGAEDMIGLLINVIPVRIQLQPQAALASLAQRIQQATNSAQPHSFIPLANIPQAAECIDHLVVFESYPIEAGESQDRDQLRILTVKVNERTHYDLALIVAPGTQLKLTLQFNPAVFDAAFAKRMLQHLARLLICVAEDPEQPLNRLPTLSEEEYQRIIFDWNGASSGHASLPEAEKNIVMVFKQQVALHGDRTALRCGDQHFDYRTLDQLSDQLALQLRALGLQPQQAVGVAMPRSAAMVIALLGIIKAGGAYLGIEWSAPVARQQTIIKDAIEDAGLKLVITDKNHQVHLPESVIPVVMDKQGVLEIANDPTHACISLTPPLPGQLAYISYTSGSTGKPKGVGVTHNNVVRLVKHNNYYEFCAGQAFLHMASLAFDAATFEIWGALLNGGCCVVMTPQEPTLQQIADTLVNFDISLLWLSSGLFNVMVDEQLPCFARVAALFTGGDVVSPQHVNKVLKTHPTCTLYNGYGPTENTTFTSVHCIKAPIPAGESVPIGRTLATTQCYVLNSQLQPVPIGVSGELYVGGEGVSRGYLGQPALTAEKFLPDPFSSTPGARMYRTGDQVMYRSDGTLIFQGRADQRVKVRGHLVEAAEIEMAMTSADFVKQAAVVVEHSQQLSAQVSEACMIAYVLFEQGGENQDGEYQGGEPENTRQKQLKQYLRQQLPDYMQPTVIIAVESLPLNTSGKLDRKQLPPVDKALLMQTNTAQTETVLPRDEVEEKLLQIWRELLTDPSIGAAPDFGVTHEFADLGGHSLKATQMLSRIRKQFGIELPIRQVFEFPTVSALAGVIKESLAKHPAGSGQPKLEKRSRAQFRKKATQF